VKERRLILGAAAAVLCLVVVLLGGVFDDSSPAGSAVVPSASAGIPVDTGFAKGDTQGLVAGLQATLRSDPYDVRSLDQLALAYQQRARETGDPTYYTKSGAALHRALGVAPRDLVATSGLGSLALSRHRFAEALALGRRAHAISPTTARNYGVIGDALAELGRYRAAFRAFDTMASIQPGLSSYARIAHARYLVGDLSGAVESMKLAVAASAGQGEPEAWTHLQLGKLYWSQGRLAAAQTEFRDSLNAFPHYPYAYDGLAQVEQARGRLDAAIALELRAVNLIPLPQFVGSLGDMYSRVGRAADARRQYATISVIERLLRANGVKTELETALFDVDHGIRPQASVALARVAQRARPSIDGDDVLAWALARTGHCGEALHYSKRALRLGTLDSLKFFHRGMIERCLGHRAEARRWFVRALDLNPHFSLLWAPIAGRYAR
jgi:tetratricopeptide (TPR) repeat protein